MAIKQLMMDILSSRDLQSSRDVTGEDQGFLHGTLLVLTLNKQTNKYILLCDQTNK
jgi:hypothetical protein